MGGRRACALAVFAIALLCTPPLAAAEEAVSENSPTLQMELNRAEQNGPACRLSFVFTNRLGAALAALKVEAVLFDRQERVERFVTLAAKPLPVSKIRAQQFDIPDLQCADLGKVLVNDVVECEAEGVPAASCLGLLELSSRTDAALVSTIDKE